MPKRILVVTQHYWPENFRITDICNGFVDSGIEVDVLCGLPNYPKGEWFDGYNFKGPRFEMHEGVNIYRCGEIRRKNNTNARIFFNYLSYPIFALFNLHRLRKFKYNAVFCYNTSPVIMMFPAVVYSKFKKVPLTTYVLDLWPDNLYTTLDIQNKFLRSVAKNVSHWFYRRCGKLISMSESMLKKVEGISPKSQHAVIPQHCEDLYFQKPTSLDIKKKFDDKFNVLFAGNISPAQNLNMLLGCAKIFKEINISNIRFIIVGDGMSRKQLEQDINSAHLNDYFEFLGQHPADEMPNYFAAADVLFMAYSELEALEIAIPAKLASYFAAGKPCVVSISGEGAQAVIKANAGLVSAPGDVSALCENILSMAQMNSTTLQKMGESAQIYCKQNFKRDMILNRLKEFILS